MSQQVRLAPTSLDAVYVQGGYITINRDGVDTPLAPGHHPAWVEGASVVFCPPEDGVVQIHYANTTGPFTPTVPAGNTLTASAGQVAVHRTDPRRVETSWSDPLDGETDPVLSADGHWLATLVPDVPPGLATLRLRDTRDLGVAWHLRVGAITRPRFSHVGTTLVWEDAGHVWGIRDVANTTSQVVRLTRDGDPWYHPVPCWCPEREELFLLVVQPRGGSTGVLVLAEWNSCVTGAPVGYVSAPSGGSGYDHDIAPDGVNAAVVAFLTPDGTLEREDVWLNQPRTAIPHPETPTIPIPPIEPPVTPPIEPPIEPPTPETDMTHDDVRRYAAAISNDLLFGAYQRFHDEVLPRDRPKDSIIPAADDSDMWTGDVTTGGAMSIFTRTYMPEAIIAQDNGRTPEQASGDGYDKGIAAYNKAVGVTPPTPPPGAFQGPVSSEGRDFVVPE